MTRARPSAGLTTMPSPPASVSSRHQAAAAEQDAGSDVSANTCLVTVNRPGSAAASRVAVARCQECGLEACDAVAGQARVRDRG